MIMTAGHPTYNTLTDVTFADADGLPTAKRFDGAAAYRPADRTLL